MTKTDTASSAEAESNAATQVASPDGDPAASSSMIEDPRTVRFLQILVVVMGVILVAGFIAVIARIAYLVSRTGEPASQPTLMESRIPTDGGERTAAPGIPTTTKLALPDGAEIISIDPLTVGRENTPQIFVRYRPAGGAGRNDSIAVFDGTSGALLRVFRLGPATTGN